MLVLVREKTPKISGKGKNDIDGQLDQSKAATLLGATSLLCFDNLASQFKKKPYSE